MEKDLWMSKMEEKFSDENNINKDEILVEYLGGQLLGDELNNSYTSNSFYDLNEELIN